MGYETPAEGKRTTESAMKFQVENFFAHRMYYKGVFEKNEDLDYIFQWILGSEANCGCSTGEMFYAASQIEDGDRTSWKTVFGDLARRVEARAQASLEKGHTVSAREGFLRASNYYRAVAVPAENFVVDEYVRALSKSRAVFQAACPLFEPAIEPIEFPYEGKSLPGYFWKAADDGKQRKTLIMIGGGETVTEDMFFYLGPHATRRGYNFVTADLPGQGMTPHDGFVFRPDSEVPMGAILDYILDRPEVDAERVAAAGQSYGGYFVPRAAAYDKRIKAAIGNAAMVEPEHVTIQSHDNVEANTVKRDDPIDRQKWKWNVDSRDAFKKLQVQLRFDPALLTCPVLSICGEGEYQSRLIRQETEAILKAAKDDRTALVVPPLDEGGAHHCTWENTYLAAQLTFDWLDELFE